MDELKLHYLKTLLDTPQFVETRDLLLWKGSSIIDSQSGDGFVVWSKDDEFGAIVGNVHADAIIKVVSICPELLAFAENIDEVKKLLTGFKIEQASIFTAANSIPEPKHICKIIDIDDIAQMNHLSDDLKEELLDLEDDTPTIVATFDDDLAVAFAYVASESETLWDISIDTIENHRRKGFAASAVYSLMAIMQSKNKTAVWGALHSNIASLNLAKKLGFVEVDTLWVCIKVQANL